MPHRIQESQTEARPLKRNASDRFGLYGGGYHGTEGKRGWKSGRGSLSGDMGKNCSADGVSMPVLTRKTVEGFDTFLSNNELLTGVVHDAGARREDGKT